MRGKALCLCLGLLPSLGFAAPSQFDLGLQKEIKEVTEAGRQVFLVSLKGVLKIADQRAPELRRWSQQVRISQMRAKASKGVRPLTWTNSINQSLSISAYTFISIPGTYLSLGARRSSQFSSGLSQKTKWGLKYGLVYQKSLSQSKLGNINQKGRQVSGYRGITKPIYGDSLKFEVKLPFLQGMGAVNRDDENRAALGLEQTKTQAKVARDQLLFQVTGVYWDLVGVFENLRLLEKSLLLSKQYLEEAQTRLSLGAIEKTEVKLAKLQVTSVQKDQLVQELRKKLIEDQIRLILGLHQFDVGYKPTEKLQVKTFDLSLKELTERALASASDLRLVQTQLKVNQLDGVKAIDKNTSQLDLNLQVQLNGFGYDSGTAASALSDPGTHGYLVGVSWKSPFLDNRTQVKVKAVAIDRSRLESQFKETRDKIKLQVGSLKRTLGLNKLNIQLAQTQVELNQELLAKETEKLRLGASTVYRRAQVQQDLTQAQLALTLAKIDHQKTYTSLLILTDQFDKTYDL